MSLRGSCKCNNIEINWHTVDYSLVPRKCGCQYCISKGAAYVSKSGTLVDVRIHNEKQHRIVTHGSGRALFHECGNCQELALVTAEIQGETYGALNANCLVNKLGFSASIETLFSEQTAEQKLQRWHQNWCHPVVIVAVGRSA